MIRYSRKVLVRLVIVTFATAIIIPCGTAIAKTVWTFGGINPPNAPVTMASEKFAEMVAKQTEGRVIIKYFGGSKLGSGPQQIEAMTNGAQEGYISAGSNASKLVKEYGIIDVAFMFHSKQHFLNFMDSDIANELNARMIKEFRIRVLATNWFRMPRVFLTKEKHVSGPTDIKGLRARSPNLPMYIQSWKNLGTVPVKTAYGEAYLAISQGLVDMTESAGEQIFSSKFYELLPYVTEAELLYPQNSVYVNEDAWQAISEKDRQIIKKAAFDAGDFFTKLVNDRAKPERKKMFAAGVKFAPIPDAGRSAFQKMVESKVPEMEAAGLMPEGWWDRIQMMK